MKIMVEIHQQDKPDIIETETYNALETFEILNGLKKNEVGNAYNNIMIGTNIYSCVSVKSIKIVSDEIK